MEPTEEEKRNGWTKESLEEYLKERERAQAGIIMFNPEYRSVKRRWANNLYNPLRWK